MPVRRIDGEHVHLAPDQFLRAFQKIARGPDRRAHAQASLAVLGGIRVLQLLLNVLDRDQALEREVFVHHQQFFHAMLVQDGLGLFQRGAHRNRDQVFLGHDFGNRQVEAILETQVAIGENAHQHAVLGDRHARDAVARHQRLRGGNRLVRTDRDRVHDHAALTALHAVHFFRLPVDRHVAMHNADAALLRQRNRQVRFRHRIHGGGNNRNIESDLARQAGASIHLGRDHFAAGRFEKNVIESQTLREYVLNHKDSFT